MCLFGWGIYTFRWGDMYNWKVAPHLLWKLVLLVHLSSKGSSYLFTEYKYPVDPGAGHRNRAEYARQYGPVISSLWTRIISSFPVWRGADSRVWVGSSPRPRPRKQAKPKIRKKRFYLSTQAAATRLPYGASEGRTTSPRGDFCWTSWGIAQTEAQNPVATLTPLIWLIGLDCLDCSTALISSDLACTQDMTKWAGICDQAIARI